MPSFDVVSEVDLHEVANAVDQANREVGTRFDFKGTGARFELKDAVITLLAENEFQLQQMMDILQPRLAKRIVKLVKDSRMKVQAAIQGDQVRISGKQRDDLQEAMALLRRTELDMPLQFINFRD